MRFLWLNSYIYTHFLDSRSDVKPDNIILDAEGHARLTDFNVAARLNHSGCNLWSKSGTPSYLAPEVVFPFLKQEEECARLRIEPHGTPPGAGYGVSVDWWALGITLYEILYLTRPFYHDDISETELYSAIVYDEIRPSLKRLGPNSRTRGALFGSQFMSRLTYEPVTQDCRSAVCDVGNAVHLLLFQFWFPYGLLNLSASSPRRINIED